MYAIQNTTEIDSDFVPATQWNAIGDAEETSDSESDEVFHSLIPLLLPHNHQNSFLFSS